MHSCIARAPPQDSPPCPAPRKVERLRPSVVVGPILVHVVPVFTALIAPCMLHAGCAGAAASAPADEDEALHTRIVRRSATAAPPPPPPPSCLPLPVDRPTWAALLHAVLRELRPDPPAEPEPMRASGDKPPKRAPASAAVAISFSPVRPPAAAAPAPAAPPSPERRDVRPTGPEAAAVAAAAVPAPVPREAAPAASQRTDHSTVPESPEREVEQPGKPLQPAAGEPGARSDRAGEAAAEAGARLDCAEAGAQEAGAGGAAATACSAAEPETDGGGASQAPTRVSKRVALRKCAHAVAAGALLCMVPCMQGRAHAFASVQRSRAAVGCCIARCVMRSCRGRAARPHVGLHGAGRSAPEQRATTRPRPAATCCSCCCRCWARCPTRPTAASSRGPSTTAAPPAPRRSMRRPRARRCAFRPAGRHCCKRFLLQAAPSSRLLPALRYRVLLRLLLNYRQGFILTLTYLWGASWSGHALGWSTAVRRRAHAQQAAWAPGLAHFFHAEAGASQG